jgi:glycolate oxidase iron-sulfur subunit
MAGKAALQPMAHEAANLDCIHCGLCLSVCPTYVQLGSEVDSPRGRIYLINAMGEGRVPVSSPAFEKHMLLCLECRACESACPSGVRFSLMMNEARAAIREQKKVTGWAAFLRRFVFGTALPSRRVLHAGFRLLRLYQKSGLQKLVRVSRVLRLFPKKLQLMEALLPEVPHYPGYRLPEPAAAHGRSRVSFFQGCIMPELFGPVHEATLRVLQRNDVSVCSPSRQTCCGALHLHEGESKLALDLARRNINAFEEDGADFVIVNAAGCGAMLKEYGELLKDDPDYAGRAARFSRRVKDIAEFLDELGIRSGMGEIRARITYDDPCHLLHGQGIKAAPRNLLRSIPGIELVELRDSDRCCGSAGIYNITHPEMASAILAEKIDNLSRTGADIVASGNPGCLLQIRQGLRAAQISMETAHPVELLDRAYQKARASGPAARSHR